MIYLHNSKPSFGGFIVGVYLFCVPVFSYSVEMKMNYVPQVSGIFLVLYAIITLINNKTIERNTAIFLYFLFTLWSITTFIFAENQSQIESLITLSKVAIITLSVSIIIRKQSDYFMALLISFLSIYFIFWLNLGDILNLIYSNNNLEENRFAGTFSNANTAAIYCLAIIWIGILLFFYKYRNILIRIMIIGGITIATIIIIYSGSRKGIIGLGFLSFFFGWIIIRKSKNSRLNRISTIVSVIVILYFILNAIFKSPFYNRIPELFQGDTSTITRWSLFIEALNIWTSSFKNLIIGIGLNNFQFFSSTKDYSHSTISETLVCTGIVGFALYYTSLFMIFYDYYKILPNSNQDFRAFIKTVFIFLFLILFFSLSAVIYSDRLLLPLIGMISSFGTILKRDLTYK
jgi:O-antigen ligase